MAIVLIYSLLRIILVVWTMIYHKFTINGRFVVIKMKAGLKEPDYISAFFPWIMTACVSIATMILV